jgi:hypothetical protein
MMSDSSQNNTKHDHNRRDHSTIDISLVPIDLINAVLVRDEYTCQMCGAEQGELHSDDNMLPTRLHIMHSVRAKQRGQLDPTDFRTICHVCYSGFQRVHRPLPDVAFLLGRVRRTSGSDQLDILSWLLRKYPRQAATLLASRPLGGG